MRLQSRLNALEQLSSTELAHCVLWHNSVPFADALKLSEASADSKDRLLIELVPGRVERDSITLTADQHLEQTKAYAWARRDGCLT